MIDLLVRGVDKSVAGLGFDDDHRLTNQKGNIVAAEASPVGAPAMLGGKQVPPKWCVVRASGVSGAVVSAYLAEWRMALRFDWRSIQPKRDSWQIAITATRIRRRDGHGSAAHAALVDALGDWGFTNIEARGNLTVGNVTVLRAARSIRLLGEPLPPASRFTELSYNIKTGRHVIEFNFDPAGLSAKQRRELAKLARRVQTAFHVISISRIEKKATFEVWRSGPTRPRRGDQVRPGDNVRLAIITDLRRRADMRVGLRRFRISPAVVDQVVAGTHPGSVAAGYAAFDRPTLIGSMQDHLDL